MDAAPGRRRAAYSTVTNQGFAKAKTSAIGPVLGIETSCDETGVGIVRGNNLLANAIASSMEEHARYGGVVPEVAARAHLEALGWTVVRIWEHVPSRDAADDVEAVLEQRLALVEGRRS